MYIFMKDAERTFRGDHTRSKIRHAPTSVYRQVAVNSHLHECCSMDVRKGVIFIKVTKWRAVLAVQMINFLTFC